MATLLSAREIAERALRFIGAYATIDSAADPDYIEVALGQLDLILAEQSDVRRNWYQVVVDAVQIPVVAGTHEYALASYLSGDDFAHAVGARLRYDAGGDPEPLAIVSWREWKALGRNPEDTGTPSDIHISRDRFPTMRVWPTPSSSLAAARFMLDIQTLSPKLALPRTRLDRGEVSTGLRASWQRWAIYRLAADLGQGIIRRIPDQEIRMFISEAEKSMHDLSNFADREHDDGPAQVEMWS